MFTPLEFFAAALDQHRGLIDNTLDVYLAFTGRFQYARAKQDLALDARFRGCIRANSGRETGPSVQSRVECEYVQLHAEQVDGRACLEQLEWWSEEANENSNACIWKAA